MAVGGWHFSAHVSAALWSALLLGACGDCDKPALPDAPASAGAGTDAPPVLIAARFTANDTLQLQFSKAMAPPDDVDPAAFRLSMGVGEHYDYTYRGRRYCYSYTSYYELAQPDFSATFEDDGQRLRVEEVREVAGAPDTLELLLDHPIDQYLCLQLDYADDGAGIFVHHTGRGIPTEREVRDADGNPLPDIAPHWVLSDNVYTYREGLFPAMPAWLPIPCPD